MTFAHDSTPNAYVLIEFTINGPLRLPTMYDEREARAAYDALEHGYLAAQVQVDLAQDAKGGQDTVWSLHK